MQSKLETQITERNKNVKAGEIIVYSDCCNYNRYVATSDQEVLTGDIQITPLNDDGSFDRFGELEIINLRSMQYGWQLENPQGKPLDIYGKTA